MMRCIESRQLTQELVASKTLDLQKANERLSAEVAAHRKSLADLKHREAELADRNKTFTELSALRKTKSSFAYRCLTPMEIQVANLVKQGKTNKGIAELLNLSRRTVEVHRYNIRKKLQVEKSRTNLKTYLSSME